MAGGLSKGSFSAGAKETAATIDVYAKSANTTVNSIQDIRKLFDSDLLENFRGGNFSSGVRPIITAIGKAGLLIDKNSLFQRLVGSNPRLLAGMKSLYESVSGGITGMLEDKDGVFAQVSGMVSKISSAALDSVKSLGSMIGDVVGDAWNFVVDDKDGISGFYSGLIKEAQALGIPGSFKAIISTVSDPNLINRITQKVLPGIVNTSDTDGLLAAALGTAKGVVRALNPQILSDFSRKYTNPLNGEIRGLQSKGNNIFRAFDAVDKGWDRFDRVLSDGKRDSVLNLSLLQNSSKDAKDAMNTAICLPDDDLDKTKQREFYTLASVFKPVTVHEEIAKDFPQAVNRNDIGKLDPRLDDGWTMGPSLVSYKAEKAKQEAYSTDMNLLEKIKNIYF
jgi:hypothetical protein